MPKVCYGCGLELDDEGRLQVECNQPLAATVADLATGQSIEVTERGVPVEPWTLSYCNETDCDQILVLVTEGGLTIDKCCDCGVPFASFGFREVGSTSPLGNQLGDNRPVRVCGGGNPLSIRWFQQHRYADLIRLAPGDCWEREFGFTMYGFLDPCPGEDAEACEPKVIEYFYRTSLLRWC